MADEWSRSHWLAVVFAIFCSICAIYSYWPVRLSWNLEIFGNSNIYSRVQEKLKLSYMSEAVHKASLEMGCVLRISAVFVLYYFTESYNTLEIRLSCRLTLILATYKIREINYALEAVYGMNNSAPTRSHLAFMVSRNRVSWPMSVQITDGWSDLAMWGSASAGFAWVVE